MVRPLDPLARDLRMWASRRFVRSFAPPDWLSVNLTLRCNLSCVMCTTCYDSPELSTKEVLDLIDQAASWGVSVFNPLGGEPFIRADLEEILAYAAGRDMHTTLTTNGTLIRPDRAARVARIPVEKLHINVSIDGPEAAHDEVRGAGSWRRTMAGYEALRDADRDAGNPRRKVCANVILHRKNLAGFLDFVHELASSGFDGVQVLNLFRNRDDDSVGGMWFEPADLPELERVVAGLTAEPLVLNSVRDLRLIPAYYREGLAPLEAPCWAGWKELYVNADGSVIMCDGKLDFLAGRFGSVREATLRQLWASPALADRRRVVKQCATPCIQNCYLRRDSDSLPALARRAAGRFGGRGLPAAPEEALAVPLALEVSDVPDDPASPSLRRLFARSPVGFEEVLRQPERYPELRDLHYLDFGRGFLGVDVVRRILDSVAAAGLHFPTLILGWRGEPLLHPEFGALLRAVATRASRVVVPTSRRLLRADVVEALAAHPNVVFCPGLPTAGDPAVADLPDGPAISWEGRVTASRGDRRLEHRIGDALKEPFGPIWSRWVGLDSSRAVP